MNKMALLALPLASCLFTGCGPRVTNANIEVVNREFEAAERSGKSVTLKEVESILGQPTRVVSRTIEKPAVRELPMVSYFYEQDGHTVELLFLEGRLQRRVLRFGEISPANGRAPLESNHTP